MVPSPRRTSSLGRRMLPRLPILESAPPTAAPAKAPKDIMTKRGPHAAPAASARPNNAPTTTNPTKISFLISSSRIQPTPDSICFKPAATPLLHFHRQGLLPAIPNAARRWRRPTRPYQPLSAPLWPPQSIHRPYRPSFAALPGADRHTQPCYRRPAHPAARAPGTSQSNQY